MNKRLSILRLMVLSGLLVNISGCFQREKVKIIVSGVVQIEPKSNTQDSLIFSQIWRLPEVSVIEMNQFLYQKQVPVPVDSSGFYNQWIIDFKLPFLNSLYPVPFLNSGNNYFQRFSAHLINLDTIDQNRWLFCWIP